MGKGTAIVGLTAHEGRGRRRISVRNILDCKDVLEARGDAQGSGWMEAQRLRCPF